MMLVNTTKIENGLIQKLVYIFSGFIDLESSQSYFREEINETIIHL